MIRSTGQQALSTLDEASRREWLLPDGTGGYAMGTLSGLRTRRYHGLLVVATQPPAGRRLALAALDPVVVLDDGRELRLATHEWRGGVVDPAGHALLVDVAVGPRTCRWTWQHGALRLEREVAVAPGGPVVAVVHRLVAGPDVRLRLHALVTWRDGHGERTAGEPPAVDHRVDGPAVEGAYAVTGPGWHPDGRWFEGAHAREEAARGLPAEEDLWHAGWFEAPLPAGTETGVVAWATSPAAPDIDLDAPPASAADILARARTRPAVRAAAGPAARRRPALLAAADLMVVQPSPDGAPDVVAGYPWFGAWSRDTMISYEGLFLCSGRHADGARLLRHQAGTLSEGMLANTADTGRLEWNTADATLWFAHAVGRHVESTGDDTVAADLLDPLEAVVTAHLTGTRFGIGVDPADGLLRAGVPGEAVTWMDARVDGAGVTPRIGKPVELQALWIRALEITAALRRAAGRAADDLDAACEQARASFAARFPSSWGWLHDVVDAPAPGTAPDATTQAPADDASLRPNQVIALALLDRLPVPEEVAAAALDAVDRHLLTPLGLRSLAPDDPGYRGRHRGGPADRDRAYHQGTVWPWLVGPYATAAVRLAHLPGGAARLASARTLVETLTAHLDDWGVGSVSETADGDAAHAATGCPFQAWSVAELLRAAVLLEDAGPDPDDEAGGPPA